MKKAPDAKPAVRDYAERANTLLTVWACHRPAASRSDNSAPRKMSRLHCWSVRSRTA